MEVKKILILDANPQETLALGLGREVRQIKDAIRLSKGREWFKVEHCPAVGPDEMRRALLEHEPHIVHFSGHGAGDSGLALETQQGRTHFVTADAMAQLLKLCRGVECVILNACYSEVQAIAIAQSVSCVIGMSQAIQDDTARKFAEGFYDGLGYGYSYDKAFEWGKAAIATANLPGTDVLRLIVRECPIKAVALTKPKHHLPSDERASPVAQNPKLPSISPTSPLPKQHFKWGKLIATTTAVTAGVMVARFAGLLQILELPAYDLLMRSRPALFDDGGLDPRILFVEVDDEFITTDERYSYPLKDSLLTEAIEKLGAMNPRAIGLDMHRAQDNSDNNPAVRQAFISQFAENPNLVTVCSFSSEDRLFQNPTELSKKQAAYQVGFSDLELDSFLNHQNGTVRRQLLSYEPGKTSCQADFSFSFQLMYNYLEESDIAPIEQTEAGWRFGNSHLVIPPYRAAGHPLLQAQSDQMLINYRAKKRPANDVSLKMLLDGEVDPANVENKIVLIGSTATFGVMQDNFKTPHGKIPGVWVHGHVISQILSTVIDERPQIWFLPQWSIIPWGDILWTWLWGASGGLLIVQFRRYGYWIMGGITLTLVLICFSALVKGAWLPLVPPLFVTAIASSIYIKIIKREQDHENQELQAQVSDRIPVSSQL